MKRQLTSTNTDSGPPHNQRRASTEARERDEALRAAQENLPSPPPDSDEERMVTMGPMRSVRDASPTPSDSRLRRSSRAASSCRISLCSGGGPASSPSSSATGQSVPCGRSRSRASATARASPSVADLGPQLGMSTPTLHAASRVTSAILVAKLGEIAMRGAVPRPVTANRLRTTVRATPGAAVRGTRETVQQPVSAPAVVPTGTIVVRACPKAISRMPLERAIRTGILIFHILEGTRRRNRC
ncbi:hypothetical protein B0H17DRAFT_1027808 [Mycena rosella]|uniref:Uncharacterized protein n=1 Tax=Mycena rosella TaxID=1033263 RepID=A0AAD7H2U8_MYCRO|nr:hypothetical protein B0H17DRAFT_1027808 [Mycena rosella]